MENSIGPTDYVGSHKCSPIPPKPKKSNPDEETVVKEHDLKFPTSSTQADTKYSDRIMKKFTRKAKEFGIFEKKLDVETFAKANDRKRNLPSEKSEKYSKRLQLSLARNSKMFGIFPKKLRTSAKNDDKTNKTDKTDKTAVKMEKFDPPAKKPKCKRKKDYRLVESVVKRAWTDEPKISETRIQPGKMPTISISHHSSRERTMRGEYPGFIYVESPVRKRWTNTLRRVDSCPLFMHQCYKAIYVQGPFPKLEYRGPRRFCRPVRQFYNFSDECTNKECTG